jgi:hypothetical protein
MIKSILKVLQNFFGYSLVALLLLSNPLGCFLLGMLFFINKSQWCLDTWLLIDKLTCNLFHRTGLNRTISGYTGERLHLKRYQLQAKVIDFIFGQKHCHKEFLYEKKKGWVVTVNNE